VATEVAAPTSAIVSLLIDDDGSLAPPATRTVPADALARTRHRLTDGSMTHVWLVTP
jgi:hypothetical protein